MKRFFWIDLEMTGLNVTVDSILEIGIVITDVELKPLEELHRIIFQPTEVLEKMNDWCKKIHGESGLTAAVPNGKPLAEVEKEVLQLVGRHYGPQDRIVLAGNSVGNDKSFVDQYMPELAKRLHYRVIDVSSFKEIFRDIYHVNFQKKNAHRATDDIYESLRELQLYLSYVNVPKNAAKAP